MVGDPKILSDLRRIEAAMRATCTGCGRVRLWNREELIAERRGFRQSMEWVAVCDDLRCGEVECVRNQRRCKIEIIPFGENKAELRQRRWDIFVVNLALTVLRDAVPRHHLGNGDTPAVRLALRVLHPHLREGEMLATFWKQVTTPRDNSWSGAD